MELENKLRTLVHDERRLTNEILHLINLAEKRKLFLERGFSSLFEWLTKTYNYSEAAAQRRIQAARLLKVVPEISQKIENGSVNLTTLAKTQSLIRLQEKTTGINLSAEAKSELVQSIENKSTLLAERALFAALPEIADSKNYERKTATSESSTQLTINISNEALERLERARDLLAHTLPHATLSDIIKHLTYDFLKRKDPLMKQTSAVRIDKQEAKTTVPPQTPPTSPAAKRRVNIPIKIKQEVFQKAVGKCEYKDFVTGKICGSSFQIELDHIYPLALGGDNDRSNFRCLCRKHNQFVAKQVFDLQRD